MARLALSRYASAKRSTPNLPQMAALAALIEIEMDIEDQLEIIKQELLDASLSYDCWWAIANKDAMIEHRDDLNHYNLFFQATRHAHLLTTVVTLYKLFEKNTGTVNLKNCLALAAKDSRIKPDTLVEVDALRTEIDPIWKKITILRSNVFSHRSIKLGRESALKKAGISPNEIKLLIENTQKLIYRLFLDLTDTPPRLQLKHYSRRCQVAC